MPWFLDSAGPKRRLRYRDVRAAFSPSSHKVGNPYEVISELDSLACTPPVNASPPPPREWPTHDSGTWLVASLCLVEDLHLMLSADFYRRFRLDPFSSGRQGVIDLGNGFLVHPAAASSSAQNRRQRKPRVSPITVLWMSLRPGRGSVVMVKRVMIFLTTESTEVTEERLRNSITSAPLCVLCGGNL